MTLEAQDGTLGLSSLKQFWGMVRMLSTNATHHVKLENIHEPWATSLGKSRAGANPQSSRHIKHANPFPYLWMVIFNAHGKGTFEKQVLIRKRFFFSFVSGSWCLG